MDAENTLLRQQLDAGIDTGFLGDISIKAFNAGDRTVGSVYAAYGDIFGDKPKTAAFLSSLQLAVEDSPQLYPEMIGVALAVAPRQPALLPQALTLVSAVIDQNRIYATPDVVQQISQMRDQAKIGSIEEAATLSVLQKIKRSAPDILIPPPSIWKKFREVGKAVSEIKVGEIARDLDAIAKDIVTAPADNIVGTHSTRRTQGAVG